MSDAPAELYAPSSTASVGDYLQRTWQMRHYAWRVGQTSVRSATSTTALGALWLFLEPVFSIIIYWVVFGLLLDISRGVDNYLAFLTVGQVAFGLSQRSLLGASASLNLQAPMLRSLAFPRAVLPLAEVFKALAAYRFEAAVMLIAVLIMGESIRLSWLLLPLVVLVQSAISFGLGLFLARVVWRVHDVQRLLTHLMRLAFYGSGVFFPLAAFTDSSFLLKLATVNPFYDVVELTRWSVLGLQPPEPTLTIVAAALWAIGGLVVGGTLFIRAEHTFSGARTLVHRK